MKKGFTLIELLIVVAIIAILAAIAVPNFLEAQTRAKVSRVLSDMRTVNTALETYKIDNNKYPPHGIFVGGLLVPQQLLALLVVVLDKGRFVLGEIIIHHHTVRVDVQHIPGRRGAVGGQRSL